MDRKTLAAIVVALAVSALAASGDWTIGPFVRHPGNPALGPEKETVFACPVSGKQTNWEAFYVYNPAAIVREGKVYMLYRAQGEVDGKFNRTSRLGLATSEDGINFTRRPTPVLHPDRDPMRKYEWPGGIEDPRIVETDSGEYVLTYSAYDGKLSRLCVATSTDLVSWKKRGPAFARAYGGRYLHYWSKSGAIVTAIKGGRQVAVKINGKYWMYWGDSDIFLAVSDDLVNWTPVETDKPRLLIRDFKDLGAQRLLRVLETRPGLWDSNLVEGGPPAILTDRGIVMIYNSSGPLGYSAGQALFAASDPSRLLDRTRENFIRPELPYEKDGFVDNVVFVEGMVKLGGRWIIYFGCADSVIGAATAPAD